MLMLISNVGLTMNTHFCGGHAMKSTVSVGATALDCGMASMDQIVIDPGTLAELTPEPCCENEHQALQIHEKATTQKASVELSVTFLVAVVHGFVSPIINAQRDEHEHPLYSPPPLSRDLAVLFQSFLI